MTIPAADEATRLRRALRLVWLRAAVTQQDVARAAGISPGYLSRIANGTRPATPEVAQRIAAALGLEVDELFSQDQL
ncbi:MAG TPA: helix-turn-helix transcriptional regulator [Solirubrobacteraceae bacterium]|nr:helix-turn-helix transcriptional regulator [Solirubrobacteraceae bacterium]